MAIFLKKFETQAAYEAAQPNLILPNVSYTVDNNTVHYNPSTPTPTHDFVEIGGVKWATMNIGANSITDTGLYFQWGDTQGYTASQVGSGEGQKYFGWEDYKYSEGGAASDAGTITKYNESDGLTTLQSSDDAVTAAWGGNWRMPTKDELEALESTTTTAWTSNYEGSGVPGLVFTSTSDSSKKLFFPPAGGCSVGVISGVNLGGGYWSSSANPMSDAYHLNFSEFGSNGIYGISRMFGYSVRGILDE